MPAPAEIEYSEEEALLARSAAELLAARSDFADVRRNLARESGYDPALYRELAELGWLGVAVPEAYGGAGMRPGALVSLAEPMGRHLFASPFLATTLAAQALLAAGGEAHKQRWLPALVRGQALGSVALSEPSGSYELDALRAEARPAQGGFVLSGVKTFALDAQHADFAIVAVRLHGRPALLLVPAAALAGRMRRELLVDETRRSARIALDGVRVDGDALLDGGDPEQALRHVQRCAWLLLAADMAGGAEGVLQLTVEYLRTRKQFGKAIGSYQALKHPMVDVMIAIEQGRSLLYHAATAFERKDPEREIALRMAKAQLGETYAYAADRAIQFHGAIGFTYECHAQLFLRRAQWLLHAFGDSLHHRRKLAELLWPTTPPRDL
jgi:alkylation response protein AidB-like acyl-CoA dehydrogenase